jgi:hypothetical protein
MINLDYDMKINELMYEVKTIIMAKTFLRGISKDPNIFFDIGSENIHCRLCSVEELFNSISTKRDQTPYTLLDDFVVEKVARAYNGFACYFHKDMKKQTSDFITNLVQITDSCLPIEKFVNQISQNKLSHESQINLHSHVTITVSRYLTAIIEARVLTLSKRFIQTELLLEAYKTGLYPFGWEFGEGAEPQSLLCYNPYCAYP